MENKDDESKVDAAEAAFLKDAQKAEAAVAESANESKDEKSYLEDVNTDGMTEDQKKQHEEEKKKRLARLKEKKRKLLTRSQS